MENKTKLIIRTLSLSTVLIFFMVLISQTLGLGKTGFDTESVFKQFVFYIGPAIAFLIGVLAIFFIELYNKEGDAQYGSGIGFSENGESPAFSYFKKFSNIRFVLMSTIVFGTLGLFALMTSQSAFTGVGTIAQQFTAVDSLMFSSALVPAAENLGSAFLIAFLLFAFRKYARANKLSKENFLIFSFVLIPLLVGIYGLSNHLLRYGGQESSLIIVFFFWSFGALITLLTGSFIPFWFMHIFNNFFFDLKRFASNESIFAFSGLVLIACVIAYFLIYVQRGKNAS